MNDHPPIRWNIPGLMPPPNSPAPVAAPVDGMAVYEVFQCGECVAGSDDEADAWHYAAMYGQDGPVAVYRITSTRTLLTAPTRGAAPIAQGEQGAWHCAGCETWHRGPKPASPAEPVAKIRWDGGENYAVHVLRPEAFADGLPHLMCEALTAAKAAQPESVKPCTDERACVNCYSGQGACLIDGHTESAAPGAVDEDTIRCTIDEGFGRYWLTMGMGERDRARAFVTRLLTAALAKPDGPRMGGGE
jgi:hypothetical protein